MTPWPAAPWSGWRCHRASGPVRWAEPDQITAAHLYLMGNRFVTGTVLTVDGGAVLL